MSQRRLFALEITSVEPADLGLRCKCIGMGEDGVRYYIKSCKDGLLVPAAEYVCTELALAVNLAVPSSKLAKMPDGEDVFASREEGGIIDSSRWVASMLQSPHPPASLAKQFSRWLGFDLFVHNPDRQIGNFMMREAGATMSLIGMDFSEGFFTRSWPLPNELNDDDPTLVQRRLLANKFPLNVTSCHAILDKVGALPADWMSGTLAQLPSSWLDANLTASVSRWWVKDRARRVARIKKDISNGKYL